MRKPKKSDIIMLIMICVIVFGGMYLAKNKRLGDDAANMAVGRQQLLTR